ncbi:toxin [Longimycelium tulufanense]|uniref:Toxin n=1 Tax=Longimycelium tulufanense TaxID=907463 RepID=A0A8J3CAG9_9PSEU|nr:DUF397 domain-containing protein [Longimycelium tulufanense]GGM65508.1 toxin [Longimycelium tulufanense]
MKRDNGWFKSSRSGAANNMCVEVRWVKSSRSAGASNACVDVALGGDRVGVRDSKNPAGPVLSFDRRTWAGFLHHLKEN